MKKEPILTEGSKYLAFGDKILSYYAAGELPQLFVERMRQHRGDESGVSFRATLVELHNTGAIDVLEPARMIATSPISQKDFFLVQNVFAEIIPELVDTVPAMLAAVKALVARGGEDLASGWPNDAFRKWVESDDRARVLIASIDPADPEDAAYVFLALVALAKTEPQAALDQAITFLAGQDLPAQLGAAKAIGALPSVTTEERMRSLKALEAASKVGAQDNLLGQIIAAAADIARKAPTEVLAMVRLIDAIAESVGDQAIHRAVSTLVFHGDELPAEIIAALTKIAHKIRIVNKGTIKYLGNASATLLRHGRVDEALALIVPILSAHEELSSLEQLDGFAHGLLQLDHERLAQIISTWLLSFERNLGEAARNLVGDHHGDALVLEFDAAALSLTENETIVLAHRAIGYLFLQPITAASIALSLVRTASAKGRQAIEEILFEPLLINFSGALSDWLKAKAAVSTDPALPTIERLLARLDSYLEGLRRVGLIKELRPSERERMIESHKQERLMRRVHKEGAKRSVLMSLVSRSVLLYGTRSISYFQDPDGKKHRNEMQLHSLSHSFEAPRLDIIEPFELNYALRVFRTMKVAP
ncbi:hypothetical protein DBIPINDM_004162 [Mesorhizobium sp. AR02]|uniref:hypothetical protein n=1 Tax=Mesorhizobium sp. AR02 TaxID=2865837 RepID=UPI00215E08BE|nr:hypothetical protein [Mesorhizobium sp. AR02]UVK50961.1 hypothetical protein DBIPINDM_004162 [Mesorhizobium sp. AR02]